MTLWKVWFGCVSKLQPSCSHYRTFLWMLTILAAFTIRNEILGVTSFVRALCINPQYYHSILHFFHSTSVNQYSLSQLWMQLCISLFSPFLVKVGQRIVILADGIKIAKEGRKMPGVKKLYQESGSNSKSSYINGQYIESLALLVGNGDQYFATPLIGRIHDGLLFTKDDEDKTILDRFSDLLSYFLHFFYYYIVADAYYCVKKVFKRIVSSGNHIITRMRSNSVAWKPYLGKINNGKGRPKTYGEKVILRNHFKNLKNFTKAKSPVYGEKKMNIYYRVFDLLLRPFAIAVRIVLVIHPTRGKLILVTTDRTLSALAIIRLYGQRFKIEVSFKQSVHTIGTYAYHFWMQEMNKLPYSGKADKIYLKDQNYQEKVRRKVKAYTLFVQLGLIAHGLMHYLSLKYKSDVWNNFHSWLRTMNRTKCPSEYIVSQSLRSKYFSFLYNFTKCCIWKKFIVKRIDIRRFLEPTMYELQEI